MAVWRRLGKKMGANGYEEQNTHTQSKKKRNPSVNNKFWVIKQTEWVEEVGPCECTGFDARSQCNAAQMFQMDYYRLGTSKIEKHKKKSKSIHHPAAMRYQMAVLGHDLWKTCSRIRKFVWCECDQDHTRVFQWKSVNTFRESIFKCRIVLRPKHFKMHFGEILHHLSGRVETALNLFVLLRLPTRRALLSRSLRLSLLIALRFDART